MSSAKAEGGRVIWYGYRFNRWDKQHVWFLTAKSFVGYGQKILLGGEETFLPFPVFFLLFVLGTYKHFPVLANKGNPSVNMLYKSTKPTSFHLPIAPHLADRCPIPKAWSLRIAAGQHVFHTAPCAMSADHTGTGARRYPGATVPLVRRRPR